MHWAWREIAEPFARGVVDHVLRRNGLPSSMARAISATTRRAMEPVHDEAATRRAIASLTRGRFIVQEKIGAGRFGAVFVALDREHERTVALKALAQLGIREKAMLRRAIVELARVASPNVVALHALITSDGEGVDDAVLVMERLVGVGLLTHIRGDIATAVTRGRPTLPLAFGQPVQDGGRSAFAPCTPDGLSRLRSAFAQATRGAAALHSIGLVHRDLHPDNILVEASGRTVVLDLGLAIDEAVCREEGDVAGTAAYMAPEQATDDGVGAACDVYALGVILFEALTGALPFSGSAQEVMLRKQTVSAPSPSFVLDGMLDGLVSRAGDAVPAALDALCVRMLRRDPALRPAAIDVARALDADVHTSPR